MQAGADARSNWTLLYRVRDGAREFAELLAVDGVLFVRKGREMTWGTAEQDSTRREDAERQLCAEGFEVARRWTFDPHVFDEALLAAELEPAVCAAFSQLRADCPDANAFALVTDSSRMTLSASAEHFASFADTDDDVLWNPAEWRHEGYATFDVPYRLVLSQHRDRLTRVEFSDFVDAFDRAVVTALRSPAVQAIVGATDSRILLFEVSDDLPELAAMRALNSEAVAARYTRARGER